MERQGLWRSFDRGPGAPRSDRHADVPAASGRRQAGPSAIAFAFKDVTRFEHSLGVHVLLGRLAADLKQQVAGLLHDISHTAFSHAVDFLVTSDEQDHHESLKPQMLDRPDIAARSIAWVSSRETSTTTRFIPSWSVPFLSSAPIVWTTSCGTDWLATSSPRARSTGSFTTLPSLNRLLSSTTWLWREATALFDVMNRDWWASLTEAFIYNEFADALREGFRLGVLEEDDLLTEDAKVLAKLDAVSSPLISRKLATIRNFHPKHIEGYSPRVIPSGAGSIRPSRTGPHSGGCRS